MNAPLTAKKVSHAKTQVYAIIDKSGEVIGTMLAERAGELDASGLRLVLAQGAQIGWTYGSGIFFEPPATA